MARLFSYCMTHDDGAAPNPFWGVCTLNICKPVIRRIAKVGDWVVGIGSKQLNFENKVIYAMKVTQVMTMREYHEFCKIKLPKKIPNWNSNIYEEKVGDCIYDFSINPAKILESVHTEVNRERDLGGSNALLSEHFYYFGSNPQELPKQLLPIVHQGRGHKSSANQPYFDDFVKWIEQKNKIYSEPKGKGSITTDPDYCSKCAQRDKEEDVLDEERSDE